MGLETIIMFIAMAPFVFVFLALWVAHVLAMFGIGEGTPFTYQPSKRYYKGDTSFVSMVIAGLIMSGLLYLNLPV
jgi:hypothetical protein